MPRFTIDVGGTLDEQLSSIAQSEAVTKAEIIRRSVATYTLIKREITSQQVKGVVVEVGLITDERTVVLKIAIP